ncbi:MAG: TonB-dependent receptor [Saprospiraceae bacterium]|nr:TonB-dependent receptor [Saprospiraceae bacterium]
MATKHKMPKILRGGKFRLTKSLRFCKSITYWIFLLPSIVFAQKTNNLPSNQDSTKQETLIELVVSASRISENILRSPVSIEQLKAKDAQLMGAPSFFDALEYLKGVQVITPSMGFKVINTRGFANTTNVRFAQLIDGIDNQAPHIGAPMANALGVSDLDIDKVEIIPGTASALYGMNAVNGLANFRTKNPFNTEGVSFRQVVGVNHLSSPDGVSAKPFSESQLRFAKAFSEKWAIKINLSYTKGYDWTADDKTDLGNSLNASVGLTGATNPAYDGVNIYGNESSNRKTLTLNGKNYVIARTGYAEQNVADYNLQNTKGDIGLYFRPKKGVELRYTYRGALTNGIYQRSNRFQIKDYTLQQHALQFETDALQFRAYLTTENTGKSYNLRSIAENTDKSFKSDDAWYADFTNAFNAATKNNQTVETALQTARSVADNGRFQPNTDAFKQKLTALSDINNWDIGAALRVQAYLAHTEGVVNISKLVKPLAQIGVGLLAGFDYRNYIIVPDGNYFINPVESGKNLTYGKTGGFLQLSKKLLSETLLLSATLRADKSDYFDIKFNPRFTAVYAPSDALNVRVSYQSGYRFPSIFEGFSNINSGGVKRVGGLRVMSNGIFENSWLRSSIDAFTTAVNKGVNTEGLTKTAAIAKYKDILQRNSYTYLRPEYVRSFEIGVKSLSIHNKLFIDADFYYNQYRDFIAQVEAYIPKTQNADSIPIALLSRVSQDRYRLWTNAQSTVFNYGASLGLRYKLTEQWHLNANMSYAKLDRKDHNDGLEDGFNTPQYMINGTVVGDKLWRTLNASVTARWQSSFNYLSFLVNGTVPEYWTMDAQVGYVFAKQKLGVKLGATNLLNRYYYSMLGGSHIGGFYYTTLVYNL